MNEPLLGEREVEYVTDCVRSGWISSAGDYIKAFEEGWAARCDRSYGIAMANGTVALQAAVAALDLSPGDEVIMPTFTIVSCAQAVTYSGARPVLVDADPDTWCMDVAKVAAAVTTRTKAIMPVHIYGHPVDMDPLLTVAEQHGLAVIEDAAEAHGATYLSRREGRGWRPCGSFGDLSVFSFYANKLVTTGEGGMVVTNDGRLAERLRSLRNLCFQPDRRFFHDQLGFNFRLTNIQAAIGVAQLERFDEIVARKREVGRLYTEALAGVPGVALPIERSWARSVYWMYGLVLNPDHELDAISLARRLLKHGVETRPFFLGIHEQPAFHAQDLFRSEHHPVAEHLGRKGLYLPSGVALTDEQVAAVCEAVHTILG